MKRPALLSAVWLVVLLGLPFSSLADNEGASTLCQPADGLGRHASVDQFAVYWGAAIGTLLEATPRLSPAEERWLDGELQGGGQRAIKAVESTEYALAVTRRNLENIQATLRVLRGELIPQRAIRRPVEWAHLAYFLIEQDTTLYLARLLHENRVPKQALPEPWRYFLDLFVDDPVTGLQSGKTTTARHILVCILPQEIRP